MPRSACNAGIAVRSILEWIAADDAERYAYYIGLTGFHLRDQVAKGLPSPGYCASDFPKRDVRMFWTPQRAVTHQRRML